MSDAPQRGLVGGANGNGAADSVADEAAMNGHRDPVLPDPDAPLYSPDDPEGLERIRELELQPALEGAALTATTWAPISLPEVLSGGYAPPEPTMLRRTDGRCLLYPQRTHSVNAEPESLKSWIGLKACVELLQLDEPALYIDFEDAPGNIASRLLALGVAPGKLAALAYIRPDEPLADGTLQDLDRALEAAPSLAVVDGVTEAFSCQGLNPLDNGDVAKWLEILPRRLVRAGAAVLLLDHVVKDREQRGRYAIGAQHKLAGVDVAYSMRVLEPFARGRDGLVAIKVEKDRPGEVRAFATDGQVALLRARSEEDGRVRIKLDPPDRAEGGFRPTVLMERASKLIENDPGLTKRAIREAVGKRAQTTDLALELLVAERFVEARQDGRSTHHYSLKPYREADEDERVHVSEPCPALDSDTGESNVSRVPPPLRDTDSGHEPPDTDPSGDRVPCCCADGGDLDDHGRCVRCWGWK